MPQKRGEDALTSTARQWPSWEKRGGWGKVTMISRGVEISIAGEGGEIVRAPGGGHPHNSYISCEQLLVGWTATTHMVL